MEYAVEAINLRAYASGAGSGQYTDFIPFDPPEFYKLLGDWVSSCVDHRLTFLRRPGTQERDGNTGVS